MRGIDYKDLERRRAADGLPPLHIDAIADPRSPPGCALALYHRCSWHDLPDKVHQLLHVMSGCMSPHAISHAKWQRPAPEAQEAEP